MKLNTFFTSTILAISLILSNPVHADGWIESPEAGSPEATVQKALTAAINHDFDAYLAVVHSEHKVTPSQIQSRRNYEWTRFEQQAQWYVRDEPGAIYLIARVVNESSDSIRLYLTDLVHEGRMPTPVWMKKDGGSWGIVVNSL